MVLAQQCKSTMSEVKGTGMCVSLCMALNVAILECVTVTSDTVNDFRCRDYLVLATGTVKMCCKPLQQVVRTQYSVLLQYKVYNHAYSDFEIVVRGD
jgi:hypothetical protein